MRGKMTILPVVLALQLGGCAVLFAEGPRDGAALQPTRPWCTTGKGWVYVDYLFAIAGLSVAASLAADETAPKGQAGFAALEAVAHLTSGLVGNARVNNCRRVRDDWEVNQAARADAGVRVERPAVVTPPDPAPTEPRVCYTGIADGEVAIKSFCFDGFDACGRNRTAMVRYGRHRDITECVEQ